MLNDVDTGWLSYCDASPSPASSYFLFSYCHYVYFLLRFLSLSKVPSRNDELVLIILLDPQLEPLYASALIVLVGAVGSIQINKLVHLNNRIYIRMKLALAYLQKL